MSKPVDRPQTFFLSKPWLSAAVALAVSVPLGMAHAGPTFKRTTIVPVDRYHHESRIVRERSQGKELVRFSAAAQPIEASAMIVFEIRSETKPVAGAVAVHGHRQRLGVLREADQGPLSASRRSGRPLGSGRADRPDAPRYAARVSR